jgi:hypothetical protein
MLPGCAAGPASGSDSGGVMAQPRAGSCHARGHGTFSLPDPRCTPGATDPTVTQRTIAATICRPGYTKTVRPPASVTRAEKRASMAAYGDAGPAHGYEYDHLIALELGGAPNEPRNLWPEPGASPNAKDELERRLHELVCSRALGLAVAQRAIASDWVAAWRRYLARRPSGA